MNVKYFRKGKTPVVKLHTVNVIESIDDVPFSLRAFTDNTKGNDLAEKTFVRLVKEHNETEGPKFSDEDFSAMMDDGVYDDECGYQLFITHSI